MKTVFSAIALTIALPTLAFAQAHPHEGHMGQDEHHHSKDCCEGNVDCCKQAEAEGSQMECCNKHAKAVDEKPAADPHAGHQGH